ncbi:unnamed protein product [Strongylus vulgaris]|uniref:Corticotropin-releasing factor domain-containing protein n=1 Tax=Strongylus vulgaris TaxID=40348 RepID=A0A3P7JDX5_STRVU|nr:unnamed protein product [Strongylus vulgaris]
MEAVFLLTLLVIPTTSYFYPYGFVRTPVHYGQEVSQQIPILRGSSPTFRRQVYVEPDFLHNPMSSENIEHLYNQHINPNHLYNGPEYIPKTDKEIKELLSEGRTMEEMDEVRELLEQLNRKQAQKAGIRMKRETEKSSVRMRLVF